MESHDDTREASPTNRTSVRIVSLSLRPVLDPCSAWLRHQSVSGFVTRSKHAGSDSTAVAVPSQSIRGLGGPLGWLESSSTLPRGQTNPEANGPIEREKPVRLVRVAIYGVVPVLEDAGR